MKNLALIITLIVLAMTPPASARGSVSTRNDWSTLSADKLQHLPAPIGSAIRAAQKACGDDEPRARTGFLRYLRAEIGQQFVSLHFDQFHCAQPSALCSSAGCMHRIFLTDERGQTREVWQAQTHEIDMDDKAGLAAVNVNCGDFCASRLLWNGNGFSR